MTHSIRPNARCLRSKELAFLSHITEAVYLVAQGWSERARLRYEFDRLRQRGELGRTLMDTGISASDLPGLVRVHPSTPQQFSAMMWRLGIERDALPPSPAAETLRAIERRCGECADWRKCPDWLATSEPAETYRAFCPNAEALDRLRCSGATTTGAPSGVLVELAAARVAPEAR